MNLADIIDRIIVKSNRSEQEIAIEDTLVNNDRIEFVFSEDYKAYDNEFEIEEREILIDQLNVKIWFRSVIQVDEIDLDSKTATLDAKTFFESIELTDLTVSNTKGLSIDTIADFMHEEISSGTWISNENFEYEFVMN